MALLSSKNKQPNHNGNNGKPNGKRPAFTSNCILVDKPCPVNPDCKTPHTWGECCFNASNPNRNHNFQASLQRTKIPDLTAIQPQSKPSPPHLVRLVPPLTTILWMSVRLNVHFIVKSMRTSMSKLTILMESLSLQHRKIKVTLCLLPA